MTAEATSYCLGSTPSKPHGHSWYRWQQTADGYFDKTGMRYESECQMMGCDAWRYCQDLEATGRQDVTGGLSEDDLVHEFKGDGDFCEICAFRNTHHALHQAGLPIPTPDWQKAWEDA